MSKAKPKVEAIVHAKKKGASDLAPAPSAKDLAALDRELLRLVQQRAEMVLKVVREAESAPNKAIASALTGEQLQKLAGEIAGPLPARCVEAVVREILSGCRALVRELRI